MVPLTDVAAYHFGTDGYVKNIVKASGLIDESEFTAPFDAINDIYEKMRDVEWEHQAPHNLIKCLHTFS